MKVGLKTPTFTQSAFSRSPTRQKNQHQSAQAHQLVKSTSIMTFSVPVSVRVGGVSV